MHIIFKLQNKIFTSKVQCRFAACLMNIVQTCFVCDETDEFNEQLVIIANADNETSFTLLVNCVYRMKKTLFLHGN